MSPKSKGDAEQDQDLLGRQLRPHAPVSVVKAAKASLKEPSRPYTPLEGSRQLFSSTDASGNRPSSSYGTPNSKLFFDGTPKLPIGKLSDAYSVVSPSRPDKAAKSILDSANSYGSTYDAAVEGSPSRLLGPSSGRATAAETVAALKASIAGGAPADRLMGWGSGGLDPGLRRRPSGSGTQGVPGSGLAASPGNDDDEDGIGEVLDPHRNDDLPARPTTSRGRPSSAPPPPEEPAGPAPPPLRMGNNAQVLGITADGSDSDSPDDEAYRHLYSYAIPRPRDELLGADTAGAPGAPQSPSPSPAGRSRPTGLPPASPATPSSSAAAAAPPVPIDPNDPVSGWRAATEQALLALAAAISTMTSAAPGAAQRDAASDALRATSSLAGHVRYMRQQPHSSRWLTMPSAAFRDASGAPLSMREAIAEHTYRLMDSTNPELLLKACGIVLRVVKSRQPLLQAAKLLYRLSKDTANDRLFRAEALLEPILRTIGVMVASGVSPSGVGAGAGASTSGPAPSSAGTGSRPGSGNSPAGNGGTSSLAASMHEPLVYLNGCLKNVSNDSSNQRALVKLGALQAMASVLTQMAARVDTGVTGQEPPGSSGDAASNASEGMPSSSSASPSDMASQVVVQVTGVLRNLAVSPSHAPVFVDAGVLPALREAAAALSRQQEVILNVGRILSKLSLHDGCQAALETDTAYAPLLVRLLSSHASQRAVLLRIAFVLGNLTTGSDQYRAQVAAVPGALDTIVSTLSHYSVSEGDDRAADANGGAGPGPGASAGQAASTRSGSGRRSAGANQEECVVKVLRLVANLAIHAQVGPALASRGEITTALQALLARHTLADAEELVLNCVCALTNLSFYHAVPNNAVLCAEPATLLRHVTPLLLCDNEEAQVEAARAYGNFSRQPSARAYIREARVLEALVLLLDHSNLDLLYSVCGTLINMTADQAGRQDIVRLGGAFRLVEVLERAALGASSNETPTLEVAILGVVLKAMFNLCAEDALPGEPLPAQPALTDDEVGAGLSIVQHVRCAEGLDLEEDVLLLADKCAAQLQIISRKFESLNLEPLSAP